MDLFPVRGFGQNYLWTEYPGEIAPVGAQWVDGVPAFSPAHTSSVGLMGCTRCGQSFAMGQPPGEGSSTDPAPSAVPVVSSSLPPLSSAPTTASTPTAVAATGGTPAGSSSGSSTILLGLGVLAVVAGVAGVAWLAHNKTTGGT